MLLALPGRQQLPVVFDVLDGGLVLGAGWSGPAGFGGHREGQVLRGSHACILIPIDFLQAFDQLADDLASEARLGRVVGRALGLGRIAHPEAFRALGTDIFADSLPLRVLTVFKGILLGELAARASRVREREVQAGNSKFSQSSRLVGGVRADSVAGLLEERFHFLRGALSIGRRPHAQEI